MRDINLIPKEYFDRKNRPIRLLLGMLLTIITFSLMLYFYILPQKSIKALEQEIKKYDDTVVEYNVLKSKLAQMEKNEKLIEKRLQVLDDIGTGNIKPTEVYELIKKSMPQDVLLTSFSYASTDVSLTGVADTSAGITEFYVELCKLDKFMNVSLSPIAKDDKGYNFTIQFGINVEGDKNDKN